VTTFGLDIGATKTSGVAVGDDRTVLAEVREPTALGPDGLLATAARVVERLREGAGDPVGPIGVGVPGLVDPDTGVVEHAVNLGLNGDRLRLATILADRLGQPVVVENDVNAATLGAAEVTGATDLGYVSLGTGLAAGLLLEGRLRRGHLGAAGEIGHIPVDPAGPRCRCGQRGCLETVASGSALAAAWPGDEGTPPAQALFAAAAAGDPAALAARDRFAAAVAGAVRLLALTVNVELVVLGGGVSQLGEPLRAAVAAALRDQAAASPFLAALDLPDRLRVLPADVPVAALGASRLAQWRGGHGDSGDVRGDRRSVDPDRMQ
jgi:predicted NBD/HSP70 family sugar kinase